MTIHRGLVLSAALLLSACLATEGDDPYGGWGAPSQPAYGYGYGYDRGPDYDRERWIYEQRERNYWERQRELDSLRQRAEWRDRQEELRQREADLRREREALARQREQLRQRQTLTRQQEELRDRPSPARTDEDADRPSSQGRSSPRGRDDEAPRRGLSAFAAPGHAPSTGDSGRKHDRADNKPRVDVKPRDDVKARADDKPSRAPAPGVERVRQPPPSRDDSSSGNCKGVRAATKACQS